MVSKTDIDHPELPKSPSHRVLPSTHGKELTPTVANLWSNGFSLRPRCILEEPFCQLRPAENQAEQFQNSKTKTTREATLTFYRQGPLALKWGRFHRNEVRARAIQVYNFPQPNWTSDHLSSCSQYPLLLAPPRAPGSPPASAS